MSELRTNSGFVFMTEATRKRLQDETKAALAVHELQRKLLGQAFPAVFADHDCPECGQPMEPYGLHRRCVCGHLEEG